MIVENYKQPIITGKGQRIQTMISKITDIHDDFLKKIKHRTQREIQWKLIPSQELKLHEFN